MNTDTLVEDIYKLVSTKEVGEHIDFDDAVETFGENIKELMRSEFGAKRAHDSRRLRLSLTGRTDKYIWNQYNGSEGEEIDSPTYVKFLYGHVIEELLLFLTKAAGHTVTSEQKVCKAAGIVGHMDCAIDGVVTDVKSASVYGFKKFKAGTLAADDPFGYVGQIKAYAHSEGVKQYGWLAMDKQNGHLTYLKYDEEDVDHPMYEHISYDIIERLEHVKEMVNGPEPVETCYPTEEDGKSGNTKLAMGCGFCQYKAHCYPTLRTFEYAWGNKHLVDVIKTPRVNEVIPDEF